MRKRCGCCSVWREDCQPITIVRKYSKEPRPFGFICLKCWRGNGPSAPVVYYP